MSLELPYGLRVKSPNAPVDDKYLNEGVPYTGVTQANTLIVSGIRHIGLTVNINNVEYWYATGIDDSDLVEKTPSVVAGGGITGATNGLSKTGDAKVALGGALTGDTTISGEGAHSILFDSAVNFTVNGDNISLNVVGSGDAPLSTWILRDSDSFVNDVIFANNLFVAVGDSTIYTSPDGITWTNRVSPSPRDWRSIAYGAGLYVAVAFDGTNTNQVMTSPDGINWTLRTSASDQSWKDITFGNGLFVAVADDNVMTSPDGITWTLQSPPVDTGFTYSWSAVAYGNGVYTVVAQSGEVMTSPDAVTWTLRTPSSGDYWEDIAYGNGLFAAVASSNNDANIMTSPDGINWTNRSYVGASYKTWRKIIYANNMFVAIADTFETDDILMSADGITWELVNGISPDDTTNYDSIAFGNDIFVATSLNGNIITSPASSGASGEIVSLEIAESGSTFTDGRQVTKGIEYSADYSAGFAKHTLVDNHYVTGLTSTIEANSITTANNGLTKSGNNVRLGGSLTGDTTVAAGDNIFTLSATSGGSVNISGEMFFDTPEVNSYLYITEGEVQLGYPGGDIQMNGEDGFVFNDYLSKGIIYNSDYSAGFEKHSLVDKNYVTGLTTTSGVQTANNGLTKNGTNVRLGGSLTGDTTINANGNAFTIENYDGGLFLNDTTGGGTWIQDTGAGGVYIDSDGGISIDAQDGGVSLRADGDFNGVILDARDASQVSRTNLYLSPQTARFTDSRTGSTAVGIEYNANYGANFTNRSLVDKEYVDNLAAGLDPKEAVKVATVAELTGATYVATGGTFASGAFTSAPASIDGYTLAVGDRILVKNQTDLKQNGVYIVISASNWHRATDMDGTPANEVSTGNFVFVTTGNTNVASGWVVVGSGDTLTLNVDDIKWAQFSATISAYQGGNGIDIIGATISVDLAANSGLEISGEQLQISSSIAGDGLDYASGVLSLDLAASGGLEISGEELQLSSSIAGDGLDYASGVLSLDPTVAGDGLDYNAGVINIASEILNGIHTANNGLTKSGTNVRLGGALTGWTTIDGGDTHGMSLSNMGGFYYSDEIGGGVEFDVQGGSIGFEVDGGAFSGVYFNAADTKDIWFSADEVYVNHMSRVAGENTSIESILKLKNTVYQATAGAAGAGLGALLEFSLENAAGTEKDGIGLAYVWDDATASSEDGRYDISLHKNGVVTNMFTIDGDGAKYDSDLSSGFTKHSIVDVNYVTGLTTTSGVQTANNGLTKSGTNVYLGGELTGDTSITRTDAAGSNTVSFGTNFNAALSVNTDYNDGFTMGTSAFEVKHFAGVTASFDDQNGTFNQLQVRSSGIEATSNGGNFSVYSHLDISNSNSYGKPDERPVVYQSLVLENTVHDVLFSEYGYDIHFRDDNDNSLTRFILTTTGTTFTDGRTGGTSAGIEYAADYSAGFEKHSLVDVNYVTGLTSTSGVQTANNGLTKNGTNVQLGGALTGDTILSGNYFIKFGTSDASQSGDDIDNPIGGFEVNASNGIYLNDFGGNGTYINDNNGGGIYINQAGEGGFYLETDYDVNFHSEKPNGALTSIYMESEWGLDVWRQSPTGSTNNNVETVARLKRNIAFPSTVANGFGAKLEFQIPNNFGSYEQGAGISYVSSDITNATFTAHMDFQVHDTNVAKKVLELNGDGALYPSDLSSGFTKHSLVDVNYVTGLTSSIKVNKLTVGSVSGNTTLTDNDHVVMVNTSSTGATISLPASPQDGQVYHIKDKSGNALSNSIVISGNGKNIDGASTATINTDYGSLYIVFSESDNEWYTLAFIN